MGRRAKQPHELVPTEHKGQARVCYLGRWYYLGPWVRGAGGGSPSAEAMAQLARLRLIWRDDPGAKAVPGDGPLLRLWNDWRESPEGEGRYDDDATRVERYLFGTEAEPAPYRGVKASEFRGRDLRAFRQLLADADLARRTIRQAVACLRACFEWAREGQRIQPDHAAELKAIVAMPKGVGRPKAKRGAVEWEAVVPSLAHLSPPLAAVVELIWWTGARPSELLGLRGGDVQRAGKVKAMSGLVLDLDELKVWAAVKREHKTDDDGYDRVLFFGPNARRVIGPFLDGAAAGVPLFRPAEGREWDLARKRATRKPGGYGTYKPRKGGSGKRKPTEVYRSHALTVAVKRARERAREAAGRAEGGAGQGEELPDWLPYDLRRACAVRVQKEYRGNGARVFLGHQVGGVTESYSGADLALAARIAAEMG
mgnify:CR=1 FL=1